MTEKCETRRGFLGALLRTGAAGVLGVSASLLLPPAPAKADYQSWKQWAMGVVVWVRQFGRVQDVKWYGTTQSCDISFVYMRRQYVCEVRDYKYRIR
jgi:hypothetical protein